MKKMMSFSFLMLLAFVVPAQNSRYQIIPQPVEIKGGEGYYTLLPNTAISMSQADPDLQRLAALLSTELSRATGFKIPVRAPGVMAANIGNILLQLNKTADAATGSEGYRLKVAPDMVTISANKPAGIFYGIQSLLQLFPKEIESRQPVTSVNWQAPVCDIMDYPRFGWRGLMFDVSRHFFTKEEVKQFIDDMVRYKYNILHWHLTDDEGWRIQIKSLPRLTEVGAWNVKRVGTFGNFVPPTNDEPRNYGGFYTQEDIREVVAYARDRYVNIVPEVDIPGHSLSVIASYPELSCTPGAETYKVRSGEKTMNWHANGFTALIDNTLCPANEKVYDFLDKVFTEVAQLFPFNYIHMGGDECAKNFWEKSPQIKSLMEREKLKDMHEVQSYFVKRVSKIISSKGKKMIGWDEILEGGLPANAAVMSWRGMKGGIEAAKMGHEVVMTPTTYVYLDYMQTDAAIEPPVYATLTLKKTYEFEPVPEGVDAMLIKGGQGNVWTEQIYNTRHLQYMVWPRAFAIAEAVWSPKDKRNWQEFYPRVEAQFGRFDLAGRKYAPAMYDPVITVRKEGEKGLIIDMKKEIDDLDLYYTFDNSFPDQYYPKFAGPVSVPVDAATLRVISYRNGKPQGRMITLTRTEMEKRAGVNEIER
jgi:hexosaminidase